MDKFFNSKNIVDILFKWKWHLAVILVLTLIVSGIISSSLVITPLYKSYTVVYPSNISPYSDENETEQMVQILQSRDIRDSVVRKFDLADEAFTIENEQMTPSMKIRRHVLNDVYADRLSAMYRA